MPDLLNDTNEALLWAKEAIERQESGLYGQIVSAVVWTDARGEDGSPLVDADPQSGSPPFSRTLTRRPIKAMRSVHVEAKEVQHRVQARCG
ncbi:hypothetical protein, partial [Stenotrophomonas maltophilia]